MEIVALQGWRPLPLGIDFKIKIATTPANDQRRLVERIPWEKYCEPLGDVRCAHLTCRRRGWFGRVVRILQEHRGFNYKSGYMKESLGTFAVTTPELSRRPLGAGDGNRTRAVSLGS